MPEPVLRRGTREDADGICALLRRAFPDNPKGRREVLDWQYWDNPFGEPVVWVWQDGDRVVGHYTVVPYPARVGGRPARLGIGIDAAVDPAHQGRQLFGPLARSMYDDALASGVAAVVCYPNDNSVRGIARQGWTELGQLRTHLLPLRADWYARRTGAPAALLRPLVRLAGRRARDRRDHDCREVTGEDLLAGADGLWQQSADATVNGVVRDAAWLRWRYLERPGRSPYRCWTAHRSGELRALAVTTEREQQGAPFTYLMELLAVDPESASALVARVAAGSPGCAGIVVATLPGTALSRTATAAGLRVVPRRFEDKPLHFGVVDPAPEQRTGWSLGWGDLDHL